MRRALVAALLLLLSSSACSKGSSATTATTKSSTTTASAAPTAPTAPPSTQDVAADKVVAATIVIQASDAGPGFTATPHDPTTDSDSGPCVGRDPVLSGVGYPTQVDGPDLSKTGASTQVSIMSSVRVAPSVASAEGAMSALRGAGVPACLTKLAKTATNPGVTISGFDLTPLALPKVGDDLFALQATGSATFGGITQRSTIAAVFIRDGRVISVLSVAGDGAPAPPSLVVRLDSLMATRSAAVSR